jgi:4-aminobutyrate aminotransferase-like enzyme
MARFATGKRGIVCTDATYHGNSDLVSQLTRGRGRAAREPGAARVPVPADCIGRWPALSEPSFADAYLDRLRAAIRAWRKTASGSRR